MISTSTESLYNGLSLVGGLAFTDMGKIVIAVCGLLLCVMIINRIVHTAGGDHVDFGIDDDDQPDI